MAAKKDTAPKTAAPAADKKAALETALAQIEKQFGKGAVMKLGDNTAMQVDVTYYGSTTIPYSEIADAELRGENVPGARTWGLGSFRLLAGLFENEEFGTYTRMTYYNPQSAIVLKTDTDKTYVLSGKDPAETAAIYRQLLTHIGE